MRHFATVFPRVLSKVRVNISFFSRSADKIIVLQKGEVVEEGPHDKLMAAKGVYYQLVLKQVRKDGGNETGSTESLDLDNKVAEVLLENEAMEEDEEVEEVIEAANGHVSINVDPEDALSDKPKVRP